MKKLVALILAILAVLALAAGCSRPPAVSTEETGTPVAPAPAPAPTPAPASTSTPDPFIFEISGSNEMDNQVIDSAMRENAKYVQKGTRHYIWSGTLEGESVNKYSVEIAQGSGKLKESGNGTFTGTVNGKKGTFTFEDSANGYMLSFDSGIVVVSLNIVSGTGELSDLRGVISSIASFDTSRCGGPYSGMLGFGMGQPPASPSPPSTPAATKLAADTNTSGTAEQTKEVYNSPAVTENGIYNADLTTTFEFHGDLEGTLVNTGNMTIRIITGKIKGENSTATFTGAVKGEKGTFIVEGTWSGQMTSPTTGFSAVTYTITGGTGELSDLHGTITLSVTKDENGTTGNYTGMLSFGE
jgi:hypothetical protein